MFRRSFPAGTDLSGYRRCRRYRFFFLSWRLSLREQSNSQTSEWSDWGLVIPDSNDLINSISVPDFTRLFQFQSFHLLVFFCSFYFLVVSCYCVILWLFVSMYWRYLQEFIYGFRKATFVIPLERRWTKRREERIHFIKINRKRV